MEMSLHFTHSHNSRIDPLRWDYCCPWFCQKLWMKKKDDSRGEKTRKRFKTGVQRVNNNVDSTNKTREITAIQLKSLTQSQSDGGLRKMGQGKAGKSKWSWRRLGQMKIDVKRLKWKCSLSNIEPFFLVEGN